MRRGYSFIGPLVLFATWYVCGLFGLLNEIYIPRLEEVGRALFVQFMNEGALIDLGYTVYLTAAGFFLAAVVGIPVGISLGFSKKVANSFSFLLEFFRSLPAPAIFPLFLFLFGIGDDVKIMVAAFMLFWIIVKHTLTAVERVSITRKKVGQIFQSNKITQALIVFWDALPGISSGLRIAFPLSLILIIVGEMFVGGASGIGQKIFESYSAYQTANLYAYIVLIGFLGYMLDWIFVQAQKKIAYW